MIKKAIKLTKRIDQNSTVIINKINELDQKIDELKHRINTPEKARSTIINTGPNEILVKIFNGQKIFLSLDDISVSPHLALDGIWEADITKAWRRVVSPEGVVLDIGANFGYYGLIASQLMNHNKSTVVYFEPNKSLIPLIKKTIETNWYVSSSKIENLAVSDKNGIAELSILKDYIGSSSLHSEKHLKKYLGKTMNVEVESSEQVQVTTVDDYCKKNDINKLDLVKLDVEGFEEKAYKGMSRIIKKSPNLIMFLEFTGNSYDSPESFVEHLKNDFEYMYTIAEGGVLINVRKYSYDKLMSMTEDWIMLVLSKKELN